MVMGDPNIRIEEESLAQVPLLVTTQTQEEEEKDSDLYRILHRLDTYLCFFGFHQSSLLSFLLSWVVFLLLGVAVPFVILKLTTCSHSDKYEVYNFELEIILSQCCLAAVSLGCVSHNLRKYGIRRFLFVDRFHGQMLKHRKEYIEKMQGFFRLLFYWILPCFLLKTAHEVICVIYVGCDSWWQAVGMSLAMIFSWVYLTTISLSACLLFKLVCNLQVVHLDNYGKLLERDSDVSVFIEEHLRLRHHLSKISHRFRIFLLLACLIVTASQIITLFRVTGSSGTINFINGGDFAVSSITQVVGIILCVSGAARISSRVQGITAVASRWHALVTCNSTDASEIRVSNSVGNLEATNSSGSLRMNYLEATNSSGSLRMNYSESDLESVDYLAPPTNTRQVAYLSTYHKRQSFVTYLQSNPGGITIFGWLIDRALINTIFFLEFSLVLFVLGKTLVFTTK